MTSRAGTAIVTALSLGILIAKVHAGAIDVPTLRASEPRAGVLNLPGAKGRATERTWRELGQEIQSYWNLRILLPDGTTVQGNSPQYRAGGLTIRVEKSTRIDLHPKGILFVPREQISALDVRTNQPVGRAVDRRFRRVLLIPEPAR